MQSGKVGICIPAINHNSLVTAVIATVNLHQTLCNDGREIENVTVNQRPDLQSLLNDWPEIKQTLHKTLCTYYLSKDYATVVGEMAPRLVEKAKLQN